MNSFVTVYVTNDIRLLYIDCYQFHNLTSVYNDLSQAVTLPNLLLKHFVHNLSITNHLEYHITRSCISIDIN